jgi:hypothetical protein
MKTFSQYIQELNEAVPAADPPAMIVLRRLGIRNYPTGAKVALYRNDKMNLDVSVPYFPDSGSGGKVGYGSIVKEDLNTLQIVIDESIVQSLRAIMKKDKPGIVTFANGTTATVQPSTAKNIVDLHGKVNKRNKQNLGQMGNSPQDFKKVVDFTTTI